MIKLEELKNMAAALTEIRSSEQINEQYLEDFLLENFTEDEIESIADLDEDDMQSFVETIGEDLDADELNAFLEESVHGQQQLDELIGAAARLVGRGIKKAAKRMTVAGRADAAERKVKKIQKRRSDRERLKKAKSQLQTMRKTRREELDPVGKEDDDIDNDGDVDSSDKYLKNRRKAITKAMAKESTELDEKLAAHIIRGDTYVGVPDRVVSQAKDKVKKINPSTASEYQKAMQKALSDLGWELTVGGKYVKESTELDEAILKPYHSIASKPWSQSVKDKKGTAGEYSQIAKGKDFTVWTGYSGSLKKQAHYVVRNDKIVGSGWTMNSALKDAGLKDSDLIARSKFAQGSILNKGMKESVELDEAKNAADHRQGLIDKIKKSGVVKSGSMSKKSMKEKAESEAQAIAARIALKHKREGTKPEPGTASAEMMKMSEKDLEDFTKMKKGAPYKVEESTDLTEDAWEEIPMMKRQLHYIKYAADEIMEYMNMTADPEEWFQNKLAHVHDQMQSLHAYIEGDKRMMAMEATDEEIRAKQTAGATKPEGIADKESEGSKKFMMMHTTQVPGEVNADEINRMNAEEIKASLQRKVSYRWNDQKIGDK